MATEPDPAKGPTLAVHGRRDQGEPDSDPSKTAGETLDNIGLLAPTHVRERGFLLEARRDIAAARLAIGMVAVFAVTIGFPMVMWVWKGTVPAEMVSYTKDIAAVETTILAAIIGFYFSATRV
jgi:hypothetical protein